MASSLFLRLANDMDRDAIWRILEPTIRAGETWALPRDWTRDDAVTYWFAAGHEVWVCERGDGDGQTRRCPPIWRASMLLKLRLKLG